MSKAATGQLPNLSNTHIGLLPEAAVRGGHRVSLMDAHQVQDYIDLVVSKGQSLGEHYVARQLEWAVVELELAGQKHVYEVAE